MSGLLERRCGWRAGRRAVRASGAPAVWSGYEIPDRLLPVLLLVGVLLSADAAAAADKVDIIHLKNGDRLTCEIKKLDRGVLEVSTDPLGTVSVFWGEVATLESPREFEIQLSSGAQFFGSLAAAPNQVVVSLDGTGATLTLASIVRLVPIGGTAWSRVDGAFDAGFSFAQANLETHMTANGSLRYRGRDYQVTSTYASNVTTRDDADRVFRSTFNLSGSRLLEQRWYIIGWSSVEQNDELSLDLRVGGGGGVGRDLIHTNYRLWSASAGLAGAHERYAEVAPDNSLEAAFAGQLDFFTPNNDKISLSNRIVCYVRLGGRGRVRVEVQSAWRHEFYKDFYWSLNGFDSFDGDPPDDQKRNDFGVSFTLGYKF
jgi:hypothetical protein